MKDADGMVIERHCSTKECARAIGISPATLTYRIRQGGIFKGYQFEYENKNDVAPLYPSLLRKTPRKPKELDSVRYKILTYETKSKRICITRCPFKDGNLNIFIGSVRCEQCPSFRGRDKENHRVACNYNQVGYYGKSKD